VLVNQPLISIVLYEYDRGNPVKSYSADKYTALMEDKDGKRKKLSAENISDRLNFGFSDSKEIHDALMKGGKVSFYIYKTDRPINTYRFTLNANWYNNIYRKRYADAP